MNRVWILISSELNIERFLSLTSPNLTNSFLWVLIWQLLVRYRINPSLPFSFPKYRLYNRSDLNPFSGFFLSIYGDRVCRGLPNEPSRILKIKVLKMFIEFIIKMNSNSNKVSSSVDVALKPFLLQVFHLFYFCTLRFPPHLTIRVG